MGELAAHRSDQCEHEVPVVLCQGCERTYELVGLFYGIDIPKLAITLAPGPMPISAVCGGPSAEAPLWQSPPLRCARRIRTGLEARAGRGLRGDEEAVAKADHLA